MTIFDGDIYIARSDTGHYKIGISKTPTERIRYFDTIMPVEVELVYRFPSDNCRRGEKIMHQVLAEYHHRGEWFNLPQREIDLIMGITTYFEGVFQMRSDPNFAELPY